MYYQIKCIAKCGVVSLIVLSFLVLYSCKTNTNKAETNLQSQDSSMAYHHFNVVDKDSTVFAAEPVKPDTLPLWAENVSQEKYKWPVPDSLAASYSVTPVPYVIAPAEGSNEPLYKHNHCPAITSCENGDLLAIWFSTDDESGLEMTILASRLRAGSNKWDPASEFFKADNRNMTGSALFHDEQGKLYHFNGMGKENERGWKYLALLLRTSVDNGATWTPPRPISSGANYQVRHQVIAGTMMLRNGTMVQLCDGDPSSEGPSALHFSRDKGLSWEDAGGNIRGIHAGIVELKDGRLMALGRGQSMDGKMPMSISDDMGKNWTYKATQFPPVGWGQRFVLKRLNEGPILLISFTESFRNRNPGDNGMTFTDKNGKSFIGHGMFAALSFDEGETWPVQKLLTPGQGEFDGGAWTEKFSTSPTQAEPGGYLAITQTQNNVIHLISSGLHYQFNLDWLKEPTNSFN